MMGCGFIFAARAVPARLAGFPLLGVFTHKKHVHSPESAATRSGPFTRLLRQEA